MTQSICVFCGARMGNDPIFGEAAKELGEIIAKNSWRLVYGAGSSGLMGTVAQAVKERGGTTFGVIPEHLIESEKVDQDTEGLIITDNMHNRKKLMFVNSDAVVLLPGGAGSMEEFFEILTWSQLNLHKKLIIIANIADYWHPMLNLIDHAIKSGFANKNLRSHFKVAKDSNQIEASLRSALNTAHV
jgi:uncharacterized protein (TIGR00730 family)